MSNSNNEIIYYNYKNNSPANLDEVNRIADVSKISIPVRQNKSSNNENIEEQNAQQHLTDDKQQEQNKISNTIIKNEQIDNASMKKQNTQNNKSKKNKLTIMDPKEVEDEKSEVNQDNNESINNASREEQNAQQPLDEYERQTQINNLFNDIGDEYYQNLIQDIELDSPGVKILENWIKTGNMPEKCHITYFDLCKFVIKAENDQYARTHPNLDENDQHSRTHLNLDIYKNPEDIFNRGTSWWFRSKQKKRANYLYELIEDGMEKTIEQKITIRDTNRAKDQDKRKMGRTFLSIHLKKKYGPTIHHATNPEAEENLRTLNNCLQMYQAGCCGCCC